MSRELDERCVRALGCVPCNMWSFGVAGWLKDTACGHAKCYPAQEVPPFSSSASLAQLLEDEIERRGLVNRYLARLDDILGVNPFTENEAWALIRATPEQRARAFLEAIANDQP